MGRWLPTRTIRCTETEEQGLRTRIQKNCMTAKRSEHLHHSWIDTFFSDTRPRKRWISLMYFVSTSEFGPPATQIRTKFKHPINS